MDFLNQLFAKQLPSEEGRFLLTKCKLFYPLPLMGLQITITCTTKDFETNLLWRHSFWL